MQIRWRMHIPVPPERVFDALNSDEGRASFWAEEAIEREDAIEFVFINGDRYTCRIVDRDRPRIWAVAYFGGVARFELEPDGKGGTDLQLTHDGTNEDEAGWLNVLFPLKAWLAHGVDLRNHDPDRTWDHGYADQ